MNFIKIAKDCYLYHSEIIEMIGLVTNIFFDESKNKRYLEFYDMDFIVKIKKKYRFLHEILNEMNNSGMSLLEFLFTKKDDKSYGGNKEHCLGGEALVLNSFADDNQDIDFPINNFANFDEYEKYLLDMEPEDFFYIFFAEYIDKDVIRDALQDTYKLRELYEKNTYITKSIIGLKTLIDSREMIIRDFFSCVRDLQCDSFNNAIKYIESIFDNEKQKFEKALKKDFPLEVSQQIMGKTFKNRGPYKKFIFMPSIFSPYKAIRFFYDYQTLIYSIGKNEFTNDDAINKLKALSDESRLRIVETLKKNGAMIGKDLAKNIRIANSTLSHHIEQLSSAGFLNEERVKNSKYYSINTNSIDGLIEYLGELFKK